MRKFIVENAMPMVERNIRSSVAFVCLFALITASLGITWTVVAFDFIELTSLWRQVPVVLYSGIPTIYILLATLVKLKFGNRTNKFSFKERHTFLDIRGATPQEFNYLDSDLKAVRRDLKKKQDEALTWYKVHKICEKQIEDMAETAKRQEEAFKNLDVQPSQADSIRTFVCGFETYSNQVNTVKKLRSQIAKLQNSIRALTLDVEKLERNAARSGSTFNYLVHDLADHNKRADDFICEAFVTMSEKIMRDWKNRIDSVNQTFTEFQEETNKQMSTMVGVHHQFQRNQEQYQEMWGKINANESELLRLQNNLMESTEKIRVLINRLNEEVVSKYNRILDFIEKAK